jgi:hypothetical protein
MTPQPMEPYRGATPTRAGDAPPAGTSRAVSIADSLTSRQWDELTDIVMRRMERAVADELARRGRRRNVRAL